MNTAGALGGLLSSVVFGFLIQRYQSYDAVLISMAAVLLVGAALWLVSDATDALAIHEDSLPKPLGELEDAFE
jgi:hypothetical protein